MQEAVPVTRPLQNHLPEVMHFTTEAGDCMPQYLHNPHCFLLREAMTANILDEPERLNLTLHSALLCCFCPAATGPGKYIWKIYCLLSEGHICFHCLAYAAKHTAAEKKRFWCIYLLAKITDPGDTIRQPCCTDSMQPKTYAQAHFGST